MRIVPFMLSIILISACKPLIPAATPPQLEYTPGVAITITDETVTTGLFRVNYPDGWRVVKISVAGDPTELVFASPEGEMWIKISEVPIPILETTLDPNLYERVETVAFGSRNIYTQGQSPIENRDEFDAMYEQVLASINIL